jgi:hypothetical protein
MITIAEFENLLNNTESSILDFKRTNYNLNDDPNNTSKFVKDIISFANTIRTESAFIILGVDAKPDNLKELIGITDNIDEAILQDKIKDKVFPRPIFKFSIITHKNLNFGVIEIPISKYVTPIYPTVKLKGLEPGKIYFRRGSTNTEALGVETININDWLKSLPENAKSNSLHNETTTLLKRLTKGDEKLSVIISDILYVARNYKLNDLISFCSTELKGINASTDDTTSDNVKYRVVSEKVSLQKIELNPYTPVKTTESIIKSEMDNNKDFFDLRRLFTKPINEIEEYLDRINENTICSVIKTSSHKLFPDKRKPDSTLYIYMFKGEFVNLYRNIRQKAIDKLMEL